MSDTESDTKQTEIFVQQLTECQGRLFGYIYSMLGEHSRAMDVVQETNLVLWRKKAEFRDGAPFMPWALAIARFQVLAHVRDQGRDKCLLDSELVAALSEETEQQVDQLETMRLALRKCMSELPPEKMEVLQLRYYRSMPIAEIAKSIGRRADAVKVALLRLRRGLADCMHRRIQEG
jgi:RNA polymerase sigma-70 factor (ECF subfamily)